MTDLQGGGRSRPPETRALFLETPSNPLFKITDLRAMVEIARRGKL
jgi:cysteine-S-conjugate beta-lyase